MMPPTVTISQPPCHPSDMLWARTHDTMPATDTINRTIPRRRPA
ncbi:hypothetical protein GXY_15827 [Novacetimonas hansenii ATCC 23769]|uniref:Uncharacterized protein n=1 Tax=Novacetimonas hansenii ATCC 23769 TaxID=714995 RepID=D5QJ32_NOVHA|nr:hypothetical protein GXY_15827 [Novacetimonas hansenii ATCC 23769]